MIMSCICDEMNYNILLLMLQEWEEKRRQNIEKMNEEMERIAEYERGQRV